MEKMLRNLCEIITQTTDTLKPSNLISTRPYNSISQNGESETIALNIVKILARTGNRWRTISWEKYKKERLKDMKTDRSHFSDAEQYYFERVNMYCSSAKLARAFSDQWNIK
jgi:hypothetical protein